MKPFADPIRANKGLRRFQIPPKIQRKESQ